VAEALEGGAGGVVLGPPECAPPSPPASYSKLPPVEDLSFF